MVNDAMGPAVGSSQLAVERKGGCALLQWALQMAMKAKTTLVGASLDAISAYGDIERECIEAAIKAKPYIHRLILCTSLSTNTGRGPLVLRRKR